MKRDWVTPRRKGSAPNKGTIVQMAMVRRKAWRTDSAWPVEFRVASVTRPPVPKVMVAQVRNTLPSPEPAIPSTTAGISIRTPSTAIMIPTIWPMGRRSIMRDGMSLPPAVVKMRWRVMPGPPARRG